MKSGLMEIKDLDFYGFSLDELSKIREHVKKNKLEEITPGFVQDCCGLTGKTIALMITPHCVGLICMGEE